MTTQEQYFYVGDKVKFNYTGETGIVLQVFSHSISVLKDSNQLTTKWAKSDVTVLELAVPGTGVAVPAEAKGRDPVNSPSHYASGGIECIEAIKASMTSEAFKGYLKGNVQKYMWRYEKKVNPVEDLKKAIWYQNRLVQELELESK